MKIKIVALVTGSIALLLAFIFWNQVILPMILTQNYSVEMKAALVRYWNVYLDKSTVENPSKLTTVATGDDLKHLVARLPFLAAVKYTDYLKAAEVIRVLEYSPSCSLIEDEMEHVSGSFHYFHLLVKEDGVWKVSVTDWILPQPDFAPPEGPSKNCSNFGQ